LEFGGQFGEIFGGFVEHDLGFGVDEPLPQILNEPKSLYQSSSGTSRFRVNPEAKMIDVRDTESPGRAFGLLNAGGRG